MPVRTLVIWLVLAVALVAAPGALASGVHVEANVSLQPDARSAGTPTVTAPSVAIPTTLPADKQDVLQLASVGQAGANAAGVGVTASTQDQAASDAHESPGEAIVSAVLPTVEKAGPGTIATVGVLALLQAFGVWRVISVGAIGLYSRLTKSELLDNEHRDKVYKLIQERPGLGVSEIAAASGLGWGTTVYHLDRLERVGFVASERGGIHKCYYPVGTVAKEARKGIGALKADTTRSIAEFLLSRPGATQSELCDALKLTPSAASKQVSKLEQAGLVRRERDWKTVHLYPQETLPQLLGNEPVAIAPAPAPASPLVAPMPA